MAVLAGIVNTGAQNGHYKKLALMLLPMTACLLYRPFWIVYETPVYEIAVIGNKLLNDSLNSQVSYTSHFGWYRKHRYTKWPL